MIQTHLIQAKAQLIQEHPIIFWTLFASAILVLMVSIPFYILVRKKTKKLLNEYHAQLEKIDKELANKKGKNSINKLINRKDAGELIWEFDAELINKKIDHLAINDMEFLITTSIRNGVKKFLHTYTNSGYELITLSKKTKIDLYVEKIANQVEFKKNIKKYNPKAKINTIKQKNIMFNLILISNYSRDLPDIVNAKLKQLAKGGLIFITGAKERKNKTIIKDLIFDLKITKIRFEISKVSKNVVLIAK